MSAARDHDMSDELNVISSIQQIHGRIRDFRKQKGLTMGELAELAGTSQQQIDRLEKGKRRLTLEWLIKLCHALECDLAELLPQINTDADTKTARVNVVGTAESNGMIRWLPVADNYQLAVGQATLPDAPLFGVVLQYDFADFTRESELIFAKTFKQVLRQ